MAGPSEMTNEGRTLTRAARLRRSRAASMGLAGAALAGVLSGGACLNDGPQGRPEGGALGAIAPKEIHVDVAVAPGIDGASVRGRLVAETNALVNIWRSEDLREGLREAAPVLLSHAPRWVAVEGTADAVRVHFEPLPPAEVLEPAPGEWPSPRAAVLRATVGAGDGARTFSVRLTEGGLDLVPVALEVLYRRDPASAVFAAELAADRDPGASPALPFSEAVAMFRRWKGDREAASLPLCGGEAAAGLGGDPMSPFAAGHGMYALFKSAQERARQRDWKGAAALLDEADALKASGVDAATCRLADGSTYDTLLGYEAYVRRARLQSAWHDVERGTVAGAGVLDVPALREEQAKELRARMVAATSACDEALVRLTESPELLVTCGAAYGVRAWNAPTEEERSVFYMRSEEAFQAGLKRSRSPWDRLEYARFLIASERARTGSARARDWSDAPCREVRGARDAVRDGGFPPGVPAALVVRELAWSIEVLDGTCGNPKEAFTIARLRGVEIDGEFPPDEVARFMDDGDRIGVPAAEGRLPLPRLTGLLDPLTRSTLLPFSAPEVRGGKI